MITNFGRLNVWFVAAPELGVNLRVVRGAVAFSLFGRRLCIFLSPRKA